MAGQAPLANQANATDGVYRRQPPAATRCASARGPYWLHRATQLAVDPLLRHPALHLERRSAAKIHHLAQVTTTDFVHLHHSDAELLDAQHANGATGGGPENSNAPGRASLAATQQQKPKTVSRGWVG